MKMNIIILNPVKKNIYIYHNLESVCTQAIGVVRLLRRLHPVPKTTYFMQHKDASHALPKYLYGS